MTRPGKPHILVEVAFWVVPALLLALGVVISIGQGSRLHPFLHLGGSALLTAMILVAVVWRPHWGDGPLPRFEYEVVGAVVIAGLLIEVLQKTLVPYARGSGRDLILDASGSCIGWIAWRIFRSRGRDTRGAARGDLPDSVEE